jgi:hypothetical protein
MLSTIFYIPMYIFFYIYNILFNPRLEDAKKNDDDNIENDDDTIDTNSTDETYESESDYSTSSRSTCDSIPDDNTIIQEIEQEIKLESLDDIILEYDNINIEEDI